VQAPDDSLDSEYEWEEVEPDDVVSLVALVPEVAVEELLGLVKLVKLEPLNEDGLVALEIEVRVLSVELELVGDVAVVAVEGLETLVKLVKLEPLNEDGLVALEIEVRVLSVELEELLVETEVALVAVLLLELEDELVETEVALVAVEGLVRLVTDEAVVDEEE